MFDSHLFNLTVFLSIHIRMCSVSMLVTNNSFGHLPRIHLVYAI